MKHIESTLIASGIKQIAGVDEAGRGPCAGPLVVAAVILKDPFSPELSEVRDSKELSEALREKLFDVVIEQALSYSIIEISVEEIDSFGLHKSNLEGMRRAINWLWAGALFWPVSLLISQVTNYVDNQYWYGDYLTDYPILGFTDIALPLILMYLWTRLRVLPRD